MLIGKGGRKMEETMLVIMLFILSAFIMFVVISNAVKLGTREALQEFKEELVEEFDIQRKE
jgi:hypothetical protein